MPSSDRNEWIVRGRGGIRDDDALPLSALPLRGGGYGVRDGRRDARVRRAVAVAVGRHASTAVMQQVERVFDALRFGVRRCVTRALGGRRSPVARLGGVYRFTGAAGRGYPA